MPFSLPNSNQAHLTVMKLLLCTRQRVWYARISEKPHGDSLTLASRLFYRETKAQGGKGTYLGPVPEPPSCPPANPALSKRHDAHLWGRNGEPPGGIGQPLQGPALERSCSELMGTCPC